MVSLFILKMKAMLKIFEFDENDDADYEIYLSEPEDFDIFSKARIELDYSLGMNLFFYFLLAP